MFSERLEKLIEATLEDGQLTQQEIDAIKKRAEAEGEDLNEVEIYIQSLMQKRQQKAQKEANEAAREELVARKKAQEAQDKADEENEKARRGNVCPHCGTPIPPLTKICPECGKAISGNETVADKKLEEKIKTLINYTSSISSKDPELIAYSSRSYSKEVASAQALCKEMEILYGDNPKVTELIETLNNIISKNAKKVAGIKNKKNYKKNFTKITNHIILIISLVLMGLEFYDHEKYTNLFIIGFLGIMIWVGRWVVYFFKYK